ncbi:hypothetical protein Taro_056928 [Colocasia esculenta]|uniref:Uncharacterized protein n=1 Tax=Colocasia esculenta TaxID=4460 RepID=A0A843XUP7_COLES|nr:hypothetical protein [Colocasia esculenta]
MVGRAAVEAKKMEGTGDAAAASAAAAPSNSSTARSWADEAEDEDEKTSPPSSEDKDEDVKRLEALRIKEEGAKGKYENNVLFVKVDTDDEPEFAQDMQVKGCGIPYMVI